MKSLQKKMNRSLKNGRAEPKNGPDPNPKGLDITMTTRPISKISSVNDNQQYPACSRNSKSTKNTDEAQTQKFKGRNIEMRRADLKVKSGRKALGDLSNNGVKYGRFSKSVKKSSPVTDMEEDRGIVSQESTKEEDDGNLDVLLLVHSDLLSLIRKIDELVVHAFKIKGASTARRKEIQSFSKFVSDMLASLKPWEPKLQNLFSSPCTNNISQSNQALAKTTPLTNGVESNRVHSPESTNVDSLISPSPLVSWRNGCNIERSRQIFRLTPLPVSKALSSKLVKGTYNPPVELSSFLNIGEDANDDLLESVAMKTIPEKKSNLRESYISSTPMFLNSDPVFVMTPRLKMSPPRSCLLLEPKFESKSTPFNAIHHTEIPESSSSEESKDMALKYPQLLGIRKLHRSGVAKKEIEASPNWLFSPPKSCVILEPPDEKSLHDITINRLAPISNQLRNLSVLNHHANGGCGQVNKFSNSVIESTPMGKEPESVFRTGTRAGENTLKRELWTRFEAATTYKAPFDDASTFHKMTVKKGFLDMLDEVSCDAESEATDGLK